MESSQYYGAGRCANNLVPSRGGGVWVVDSCTDAVTLLDGEGAELLRLGGGYLHAPVTVVERLR